MEPPVFLKWNPTHEKRTMHDGVEVWEGRWVIYVKLAENAHPDANHNITEIDEYFDEHDCWARKLQTYETEDGEFAPADMGLVKGLRIVDAWNRRDEILESMDNAETTQDRIRETARKAAESAASHYFDYNNPKVSMNPETPHPGSWRHRIR